MDHSRQQISAITQFIPAFEADGYEFGSWSEPVERDGYFSPSFFLLSDEAQAFIKALYDANWIVTSFDWGTYATTTEAQTLRDDPRALETATEQQLAHLLTVLVRQNRFVDGSLSAAYSSGLLLRILKRLEHLQSELDNASA